MVEYEMVKGPGRRFQGSEQLLEERCGRREWHEW
jgi:hypothetical protein